MTQPQLRRWHAHRTLSDLEGAVASEILRAAQDAVERRGVFRLVLAGGNTPRRVYERLRGRPSDWAAWHVYFGDERCLPAGHAELNCRMAATAWLDHVPIPAAQIHPIPAWLGAERAAAEYAKTLENVGEFDLVLLGLGEDGHTASLFPGREWGAETGAPSVLAVLDAPKPPPQRVSLSAARLGAARRVMFLVSGEAKRQAVADWRTGKRIPAAAIAPAAGVDIYLEAALLPAAPD